MIYPTHRLKKRLNFLKKPDIGMVGNNYTIIDTQGNKLVTTENVFIHPNDLKLPQIACNQFGHGSVMMRKTIALDCGGYDSSVGHVERLSFMEWE